MTFHSDCYNKDFMLTYVNICQHFSSFDVLSLFVSYFVSCEKPFKIKVFDPFRTRGQKRHENVLSLYFIYIVIRNIKSLLY